MTARTAFTAALFQEVESLCGKTRHPPRPTADINERDRLRDAISLEQRRTSLSAVRKEVRLKADEAALNREVLLESELEFRRINNYAEMNKIAIILK